MARRGGQVGKFYKTCQATCAIGDTLSADGQHCLVRDEDALDFFGDGNDRCLNKVRLASHALCCVLCAVCCVLCAVCCVLCVTSRSDEEGRKLWLCRTGAYSG